MVKLVDSDIKTREVLAWQGVHLLHFSGSACSQKTRIFLNLKGIDWVSHPVNLASQDNYKAWFLGVNPRGLVPVLVHDGEVHIESNDILAYLDASFAQPRLIPQEQHDDIMASLKIEDDLHLDLRTLTMRFVIPKKLAQKSPQAIKAYAEDAGTVAGQIDPHKDKELKFWRDYAKQGVTDEQASVSLHKFKTIYDELEARLQRQAYLAGDDLSLMDIAWFIYTDRLNDAAYPFSRVHPKIFSWYQKLKQRPEFAKEVRTPMPLKVITKVLHAAQAMSGKSLAKVAGF